MKRNPHGKYKSRKSRKRALKLRQIASKPRDHFVDIETVGLRHLVNLVTDTFARRGNSRGD